MIAPIYDQVASAVMQRCIRRGEFIVQCGLIDVTLTHSIPRGRMMVIVFGWEGSGFLPDHFSLN